MRATETVEVDGRTITVRELTVGEVRAWLAALAAGSLPATDAVGALLFEDFTLPELALFADFGPSCDGLAPSDLRRIYGAARRLNPDFFGMRDRLAAIGRAAGEMPQTSCPASNRPSPP